MRRILLKLSGELLEAPDAIHNQATVKAFAKLLKQAIAKNIQVAVVVGGGNIWRHRDMVESGIERTKSDRLGMLATIYNAVALETALVEERIEAVTMSAINIEGLTEPMITSHAVSYLEQGVVVLCAGGTNNPFCTTDLAAALRAAELECDAIIKATNVDGVYTADPAKDPSATLLKDLTYNEAIQKNLHVMDLTAFALCKQQNIPICVCNASDVTIVLDAMLGKQVGTLVHS